MVDDGGTLVLVHESRLAKLERDPKRKRVIEAAEREEARRRSRREQGGLSPTDPRYGQAAHESFVNQLAEEEQSESGAARLYELGCETTRQD